jgi:hypothetical protein
MRTSLQRVLPLVVGTKVHKSGVVGTHDFQLAPPVTRPQ